MRVGSFGLRFVFWMFVSLLVSQCVGVFMFVATLIKRNQVNVAVPDAP